MQIIFNKNSTTQRYFNYSVVNNNASDYIDFILTDKQDTIVLSKSNAYIKSTNHDYSFIDKQKLDIEQEKENLIKLRWYILRKHTLNKFLKIQLVFEDVENDIVWQTKIISFNFHNTIDANTEIENKNPSILEDFSKRISTIENSKEKTIHYVSTLDLPALGDIDILYIVNSENKIYRWDAHLLKYVCVGSNYNEINIINGGILNE